MVLAPPLIPWSVRHAQPAAKSSAFRLCLLFIHPRAPNLISLRSAGCPFHKFDPRSSRSSRPRTEFMSVLRAASRVIAGSKPAQERRDSCPTDTASSVASSGSETTVIMKEAADLRNGCHAPHRRPLHRSLLGGIFLER